MARKFGNSSLFQQTGIFGAEDGAPIPAEEGAAPAPVGGEGGPAVTVDPNDGTTTVVTNDPTSHVPDPDADTCPLEDAGEITLITEPSDDDVDVIDNDDDDASADIDEDVTVSQALADRIGMQMYAAEVIEQNGVDPLTIGMLRRSGLLSQSALNGMSSESFTDRFIGSADSVMSCEALAGEVAEAGAHIVGESAAKKSALEYGAHLFSKLTAMAKPLTNAVRGAEEAVVKTCDHAAESVATEGADKAAGDAVKAAAKTTKETIAEGAKEGATGAEKAVKYLSAKNAIIATTAAVAVAGGLAMLLRSFPAANATAEAKNGFYGKVVNWVRGVKLPWAKLDVSTGEGGEAAGKLMVNGKLAGSATEAAEAAAAKAGTSGAPGWTKSTIEGIKSSVTGLGEKVASPFTDLSGKFHALSGAGRAAGDAASAQMAAKGASASVAKAAGVFAHSSYVVGAFAMLSLIAAVIYFVVVGGLRLVRKSLGAA